MSNQAESVSSGRVAGRHILLVNLGTPDAPEPAPVRRYLREFLSDPRVIEVPRLIWWLVLNGIILVFRPRRVAALYRKIWQEDSPIRSLSIGLAGKLQARLPGDRVAAAMTYGHPSLRKVLADAVADGAGEVVVLPMYPQYSATTTGAVFDQVAAFIRGQRNLPAFRLLRDYHLHPLYIDALAQQVRAHWETSGRAERLLMSFHGLPAEYCERGDPYARECQATARALAKALELSDDAWLQSFQSRFGPREWLRPYTDEVLVNWGKDGIRSVDVLCPGFAVDCLETLEEIALQNQELYCEAGGERYSYIPALNDGDAQVELYRALITGD